MEGPPALAYRLRGCGPQCPPAQRLWGAGRGSKPGPRAPVQDVVWPPWARAPVWQGPDETPLTLWPPKRRDAPSLGPEASGAGGQAAPISAAQSRAHPQYTWLDLQTRREAHAACLHLDTCPHPSPGTLALWPHRPPLPGPRSGAVGGRGGARPADPRDRG
ncbi:unnamed protein product [Rangifer tarandus platyrhynchus]|uniref:Uncharacterized protein n=1 Tax=Rangifer tarandus platyrhynchus TaxID=3082113 RepID=A0AC60AAQ3_RANTA